MSDEDRTAPNADNTELPAQVPDPMTDDLDAGEVATDATADDALGLRENQLLPNGEALHDANQDVDPADQHDDPAT